MPRGHIKMTLALKPTKTWQRLAKGIPAQDVHAAVAIAVEETAKEWLTLIQAATPSGHATHGASLRDHWHISIFDLGNGKVVAKIYNDLPWAPFVEYGTKGYTIIAKQRPEGPLVIRPKNGRLLVWSDGGFTFAYPEVIQDYKPLVWANVYGAVSYAAKVTIPARPAESMVRSTRSAAETQFRRNLRLVFRELLGRS